MSDYTKEQFEQLPEFARGEYEQVGDGYRHKSLGKVDSLKQSLDSLDGKLKEFQRTEAEKIEAARKEALETAKSKGDTAAVEKRYQEQMADLEKRNGETLKQYEERIEKMAATAKKGGIDSVISKLSSAATTEGRAAFDRLIRSRIDYNPETGETIYLDDSGSATSLDLKGFQAEIAKDPMFKPLLAAEFATHGGGLANGGGNGGGASVKSNLGGTREERAAAIKTRFKL